MIFSGRITQTTILFFLSSLVSVVSLLSCTTTGSLSIAAHYRKGKARNWPIEGGGLSRNAAREETLHFPLKLIRQIKTSTALTRTLTISDSLIYAATRDGRIQVYDLRNGKTVGKMKFAHPAMSGITVHHQDILIPQAMGKNTLVSYHAYDSKFNFIKPLGPIETSPLVYDDYIYVATQSGTVYCLDYKDGNTQWSYKLEQFCHASPALYGNTILIADDGGWVYAFNRFRGTLNWKTRLPSAILHPPVVDSNDVYVALFHGSLACLDAVSGRLRWINRPDPVDSGFFYAAPAIYRGWLLAGSANGTVYALRTTDGKTEWSFRTNGAISVPPLIAGQVVLIGSQDHHLYALRLSSGEVIWKFKTSGRIKTHPALYGDFLIVAAEDKSLYIFRSNENP